MKKGVVTVLLIGIALRLAMASGAGETLRNYARELGLEGSDWRETLSLELGQDRENKEELSGSDIENTESRPVLKIVEVELTPPPKGEKGDLLQPSPEIIETNLSTEADIRNDTNIDVDIEALASQGLELELKKGEPQVLIVHTHGSEAYAQDEFHKYEESDVSRTEDKEYNVIRVGDRLTEVFEEHGLTVIHDREIYDYPSYTGSYTRSGDSVKSYIEQYPSIKIVIDLHRDAIGSGDTVYKTKAELGGKSCAQVMLLVGTGENGLAHPNWQENLKLALFMQNAMDYHYPSLARPIALKPERYNQHLTKGSLILEVGSSGNTLSEALLAIELFGDSVGAALAELIEDEDL